MDELQAGIEPSLAVLPQAPVFLQPGEAALNYPALGNHRELCNSLRLAICARASALGHHNGVSPRNLALTSSSQAAPCVLFACSSSRSCPLARDAPSSARSSSATTDFPAHSPCRQCWHPRQSPHPASSAGDFQGYVPITSWYPRPIVGGD